MLCSLPCSKVWAHLSLSLQLLRAGSAGVSPTLGHIHWGSKEQGRHHGCHPLGPTETLPAPLGQKGIELQDTVVWAHSDGSSPGGVLEHTSRNLCSGNTLASRNNWEIYLQIPSNMRHHVKIRLKWLIWGNCRRNSPSLCHFFIILK